MALREKFLATSDPPSQPDRLNKVMTPMAKTNTTSIEDRLDALDPGGPARDAVELRAIHDIAVSIATNE